MCEEKNYNNFWIRCMTCGNEKMLFSKTVFVILQLVEK